MASLEFLVEKGVTVSDAKANLERFTVCNKKMVGSAVSVAITVNTRVDNGESGASTFWDLFETNEECSTAGAKKRRKRERTLVKILVVVTKAVRKTSDIEHTWHCRGLPDSSTCFLASLATQFLVKIPGCEESLSVAVRGDIAMTPSQPFSRVCFPLSYTRPLSLIYRQFLDRWDPNLQFSIVNVDDVANLYRASGTMSHFAARALIRASVLLYTDAWTGRRVLLIPDVVSTVMRVQSIPVGAAEIFAIHKLFTTLPTRFYVDDGNRLQQTRSDQAMVYDDETHTRSMFAVSALPGSFPVVSLKPSDDVPPWNWPTADWFCTQAVARRFSELVTLLHKEFKL